MTLEEILAQLQALGNEKVRAHNKKNGAHDNQFGVRLGDIRNLAKQIKAEPRAGHRPVGDRQYRRPAPGNPAH